MYGCRGLLVPERTSRSGPVRLRIRASLREAVAPGGSRAAGLLTSFLLSLLVATFAPGAAGQTSHAVPGLLSSSTGADGDSDTTDLSTRVKVAGQAGLHAASASAKRRAEAQEQRRAHAMDDREQRRSQAAAHAQMPDTMYASTPDPSPPPHSFPLEAALEGASAPVSGKAAARSTAGRTHRIALFPAADDVAGRQGFARIVNRSQGSGEVRIEAYDDAGMLHGPVTLRLDAGKVVHFNSSDLEEGNEAKGLSGATGAGTGHWRLALSSALALDVLSYIRTRDGFLTSMHDVAPETSEGHRVVTFNPGRNVNQVSRLRVVNLGGAPAEVRIGGTDDAGKSPGTAVTLTLAAGASRTLSARELESGSAGGLSGALGRGKGKWRLEVSSGQPLRVLSLLSSPTGHLTNISSVAGETEREGTHEIPYFPAASRRAGEGVQGFARVINRTGDAGEVHLEAFDDAGVRHGPVSLTLEAHEVVHFNSSDLEEGNAAKGLSGGIGAGSGDWRLEVRSTLELDVLSYIRTSDGFLTSMHDVVPETPEGYRVVIFNPGRNVNQVSRLRVANVGAAPAEVRIEGTDDAGASPGSTVMLTLAAGASRTLSARELESGSARGLSGALGTGKGKWRLKVSSGQPLRVLSLLASPTGHLTNLSGVPGKAESAEDVFHAHISGPIVQSKCVACHVEGGVSGNTRLVFVPDSAPDHEPHNLGVFRAFLDEVDDAAELILNKIQGVAHGGGVQVAPGSPEFADMQRFLALFGGRVVATPTLTPETLFATVKMAPWRKTLRRAAILFAGRNPTEAEYAAVAGGDAGALRATIRGLMTGPEFHDFLTRGANDRLLTDRNIGEIIDTNELGGRGFVEFANESFRRAQEAFAAGRRGRFHDWNDRTQHGFRRAPVELIAHVAQNDLPYTEIIDADYIMANPWAAAAYGAGTRFDDPDDVHEFKPSRIASFYRQGEDFETDFDRDIGELRVLDPGPLKTVYPHAGVLNTNSFLFRYPTTATNRNRARSRWTYYHFLNLDIEKSASRTTDPEALADTNNPTMYNPACTVCHTVLDPVAGVFQNYGDEGYYRDSWGGLDSLDDFYKEGEGANAQEVRADSWEGREALRWPVFLDAGTRTLKVYFPNSFWHEATRTGSAIYLDRLRLVDAHGTTVDEFEFENLGPQPAPRAGSFCGDVRHNPATGRRDHYQYSWGGDSRCALFIEVAVPARGRYEAEVVAWARPYDPSLHWNQDPYSKLRVQTDGYRYGDTWYRDVRDPGFGGERPHRTADSVQWLAERIVADPRFAESTVKFWWPAVFGSEVTEPPENETDADFEGRLLAANAQGTEVERLSEGLRNGFHGGRKYNLKDLLVEMVSSPWFRAESVSDEHPVRQVALRHAGARRLLAPEELARKTLALTGVQWRREHSQDWPYLKRKNALTHEYRLLYGGIDSDGVTQRSRDLTTVMAGVAKRHAMQAACAVVTREFYLRTPDQRYLLGGLDRDETAPAAIRAKLVELHEVLLGVQVAPDSADVETAWQLFAGVVERRRSSRDDWFSHWDCYAGGHDEFFFDGLLSGVLVEVENERGNRWYDLDWDRVRDFMRSIDFSDPKGAAQAWVLVLTYLLTDYRYLSL